MTNEDVCHREAIRALVTRYNINGDRARGRTFRNCNHVLARASPDFVPDAAERDQRVLR